MFYLNVGVVWSKELKDTEIIAWLSLNKQLNSLCHIYTRMNKIYNEWNKNEIKQS